MTLRPSETFCKPVSQTYRITLERDRDGGSRRSSGSRGVRPTGGRSFGRGWAETSEYGDVTGNAAQKGKKICNSDEVATDSVKGRSGLLDCVRLGPVLCTFCWRAT